MGAGQLSRRGFLAGVGLTALSAGSGRAAARSSDRYVVGTETPAATRAAERAADAVHRVLDFGDVGTAVAGVFPEEALGGLRHRPGVRYVEEDGTMHAVSIDADDPEVPWGVDRVDAEKAHAAGATGAGADVAIVDTGIDSDHPDLAGNLGTGEAFVSARGKYDRSWDDDNGHGTHCAGIADAVDDGAGVVGTSTRATLHAVKVLDKQGSGSYSDVAAGIKHVADEGWDVGSLSLGGPTSRTIEDACRYAHDRDVLLVAAAGNDGENVEGAAPATYPTVMAVSATDDADRFASFSNYGSDVELAAPGVDVRSTYAGGGYRTLSGTSMACPHVSGAGAQLIAQGYARDDARQRLADSAEDVGLPDAEQGAGLLDVEAAVAGSTDGAPSVSWVAPTDGETVSGTVTLRIDAGDDEDATGSLTVEWRVDGGEWRATSFDSGSGYYGADWDTTAFSDGDHTLAARATDGAGNASTATVSVTVDNVSNSPTGSIDETSVAEADSPNPHAEFAVPWRAADGDDDLDTVELTLVQTAPSGGVEDSTTVDVAGGTAEGTATLTAKHDDGTGHTYDVSLVVTDAAGRTGGETVTVTENGS